MERRPGKKVRHQRGGANAYTALGYKAADAMLGKPQLLTTLAIYHLKG